MLNVVETFSGIGSQAKALKNINATYNIKAIVEWEVSAIYAYDIIHNGPQSTKDFDHFEKAYFIEKLKKLGLSSDGKVPLNEKSLIRMNLQQLKSLYIAIKRTNNLIDITQVKATDIPEDIDLLTYSFPCQDLSVSSFWHNNMSGIDRNVENRSGLLWQIERILGEYVNLDKKKPTFLLMENVSNILSPRHKDNFDSWKNYLCEIGYKNFVYTLNATNFGVPQNRKRTYMVSVLTSDVEKTKKVNDYMQKNNLMDYKTQTLDISEYLRLDYSNPIYLNEAKLSAPRFTTSRQKIYEQNQKLVKDNVVNSGMITKTITTKQDRHPNAGIITLTDNDKFPEKEYRNLTPRECFLLMGFDESDFNRLLENNFQVDKRKQTLGTGKLLKLAGNSIVVPVLEKIFEQIIYIKDNILDKK